MNADTIFTTLRDAAERKELLLVDGGLCWYVLRGDHVHLNIMISTIPGTGSKMLAAVQALGVKRITLDCMVGSPANAWFLRKGFKVVRAGDQYNLYEWVKE